MTGLEAAVRRLARQPFHPGVAVSVHGPGGEQHLAAGDLTVDTPCYFASATKLMVATVLHQLARDGLDLDAPLVTVVPLAGLLVKTASLDDLFLKLTGHQLSGGAAHV